MTYLLARRFVDKAGTLFATGLVAIDSLLVLRVRRVYSEVLVTPLLLVVLAFLWAQRRAPPGSR